MFFEDKFSDFQKAIQNGTLRQSYLFYGDPGIGKFEFGRSLLNFFETKTFALPSSILVDCREFLPDEKGVLGIDAARELKFFLSQKPLISKYRGVLVNPAEALTVQAQNALLKTIEEPPPHSLLIFIGSDDSSLLPTVLSRLTKIYFPRPPFSRIKRADGLEEEFETLYNMLSRDPVRNSEKISFLLKREVLIRRYNLNQRLQLELIRQFYSSWKKGSQSSSYFGLQS